MPEFTGEVYIEAFDLLTVCVMVEQCEPELTVVTFWKPPHVKYGASVAELQRHTWCLSCLLKDTAERSILDGRAAVIDRVKNGRLHVVSIGPRSDTWRCPRCSSHLHKVNGEWRNFLLR